MRYRGRSAQGFGDTLVGGGPAPRRSCVSTPSELVVLPPIVAGASAPRRSRRCAPLPSTPGKLRRLGLEPLVPAAATTRAVRAFIARGFGAELADVIVEPLMSGIYGQRIERISAKVCLPRLRELELWYGSVTLAIRCLVRTRRQPERVPVPATVTFRRGVGSLPMRCPAPWAIA